MNFTHPRQWREYSQRRLAIIVKLVGTEQFCTEGVTNNPVERSFHYSRYVLRIFKIAKPECKTTSTIAATTSSQVKRLRGWKSKGKDNQSSMRTGTKNTQNWSPMCQWSLPEPNQLIKFFLVRVLTCPPKQAGSICLEYTTYNHQDLVACITLDHGCSAVAWQSLTVQSSTVTSWSSMLSEPTLVRRKGTWTKNTNNKEWL